MKGTATIERIFGKVKPPPKGVAPGRWRTRKRGDGYRRYSDAEVLASAVMPSRETLKTELRK
ncbi:MAG: hypothetical protein II649_02105 [Kiritimatiellae bacterium]|nr:hypothetical protein [Kiritimatiellia bacterium]